MEKVNFTIKHQAKMSRTGQLQVKGQVLQTPLVVHAGLTVQSLPAKEIAKLGGQAIKQEVFDYWLSETKAAEFGDLHQRLHWSGLIVGDPGTSRAYQWAKPRGRKKDGVRFHDPQTGQLKFYTPEEAMEWQEKVGCDFVTSFDRWSDYYAPVDDLKAAATQTASWLGTPSDGLLASVVGGGLKRVRMISAQAASCQSFAGYAVKGIGNNVKLREQARLMREVLTMLPGKGLHYLTGSNSLEGTLLAMLAGYDLVDSDCAVVEAHYHVAFVQTNRLHLDKQHFVSDQRPIDANCQCPVCQAGYSRSYLHQLCEQGAALGDDLLIVHNLYTLNQLAETARQAINAGVVHNLAAEWAIDELE